jgi:hypothetical protein
MNKTFRPWNPEQTLLLLPSTVDWLPENHLVFFLLDLAAEMDLAVSWIWARFTPTTARRIRGGRRRTTRE